MQSSTIDEVTDAVLTASRVLVAVAARSLAGVASDVTLVQYRALVVLCSRGPQTMARLAEALECSPSTATRLCDRLVARGLVERAPRAGNRRVIEVSSTAKANGLVREVTVRRRRDIAKIVRQVNPTQRGPMVDALRAFAEAAGETPEQAWSLGWTS